MEAKDQGSANVEKGTQAVKNAAEAFEQILGAVGKVAQQMQEISAATGDCSINRRYQRIFQENDRYQYG